MQDEIRAHWGDKVFTQDGRLIETVALVFSDKSELKWLEN